MCGRTIFTFCSVSTDVESIPTIPHSYPGEIYDDLSERLQCAVSEAMKRYAASKDKNIHKLMKYADQLRVKPVGISYGWKLLHALT